MEILAKLSSHEFYNQRKGLVDGAYEVVEHDGEINIAVVHGLKEPRWYDQAEWEENQESLARELELDFRLDRIMGFEPDDLDDNEYNQMVIDVYATNESDSAAFDDSMAAGAHVNSDKTIADLLRESMAKEPVFQIDITTPTEESSIEKLFLDNARIGK